MTSYPQQRSNRWYSAVVLAASALAFALSVKQAAATPIDVDELFEVQQFIVPPLIRFFTNYFANGQLPHVLLTKLFAAIHWDIFTLRMGSIVAGTLAIPLMARTAAELLPDRHAAALSAVLLSLTLTHIRFAAFIRGYSLHLLLALLILLCFCRALQTAQLSWWLALATAVAIAMHNHVFIIFLLPPLGLYFLLPAWQQPGFWRANLRPLLAAGGLFILLMLPMPLLLQASRATSNSLSDLLADNTTWPTSFPPFTPKDPLATFIPLMQMAVVFSPGRTAGWPAWLFAALFAVGAVTGLRCPRRRRATVLLLLVIFLPPLLMTTATTLLGDWFYALRRYFLFVLPPYLLLAAAGILATGDGLAKHWPASVQQRQVKISGMGILTLLVVWPSVQVWLTPANPAVAGQFDAARYLNRHAQPGDLIVCVPDADFRIAGGREFCSLTLHLYPALAPTVYSLDHLTDFAALQTFITAGGNCTSRYVHLPHPKFEVDCNQPPPAPPTGRGWLVLWRSRDVSQEAARLNPPHPATAVRFPGADILRLSGNTAPPEMLAQAADIAVAESATPPRQLENAISKATLALATGRLKTALDTLDKAAFVSRWPEAVTRLNNLQVQLSYLPLSLEPKIPVGRRWGGQVTLVGIDQDLASVVAAPGRPVQISFYWRTGGPVHADYNVLLHLRNSAGNTVAAFDFQPFDGTRPFSQFPPDHSLRESRMFDLPADLPPGDYSLVVGLYSPDSLEPLPLDSDPAQSTVTLARWHIK